jgi:hypothetical protein
MSIYISSSTSGTILPWYSFYFTDQETFTLPGCHDQHLGKLPTLGSLENAFHLFNTNSPDYLSRARVAFPFLLKGPQPVIKHPNSKSLISFNTHSQSWEIPERSVLRERETICEYLSQLNTSISLCLGRTVEGYSEWVTSLVNKLPVMNPYCRATVVTPCAKRRRNHRKNNSGI